MAAKVKKGFGFQLYRLLVIYPGFRQANTGLPLLLLYSKILFIIGKLT
jgi:hypothetical protein